MDTKEIKPKDNHKDSALHSKASNIRRLAEKRLTDTAEEGDDLSGKSPEDMASLIHELSVHQIELEMQNEELRRIQAELEKTKERYSHLYDFAPTGYFTMNENGTIKEANLTIASMLGVARGAVIGKPLTRFIMKDDQDIYYIHKQRLLDTEEPQVCELRLVKKDGQDFFASLECLLIEDKEKELREIRVVVSDITERKQVEKTLRRSEAFLYSIIEHSPHAMWISDDKGTLIRLNQACRDLLHITDDEVVGKYNVQQDNIVEAQGFMPLIKKVFEKGETVKFTLKYDSLQLRHLSLAQTTFVVLDVKISPILDVNGRITNAIIQHIDITEVKQAEEALRESKAHLEKSNKILSAVLDHTHVMSVFLDPQFNFIWVNTTYAATCGHEPSFFPGRNHFDLYPNDENQMRFQQVVDTGEPFFVTANRFEFPDQPERGVTYWDWSLVPEKDHNGKVTGLVFTLLEVTDRVRAEKATDESEIRYRLLFENMLNGYAYCRMVFDQDNKPQDFVYLDVNPAFETQTGLKAVVGAKVSEIIPEIKKTDSELIEIYGRVTSTGIPEQFEIYVKSLSMWFSVSVFSPEKEHFVTIFEVITERKKAEESLRNSERQLKLAQQSAGAGIWDWDLASGRLDWSRELFVLFGLDPDNTQATFDIWNQVLHPDDKEIAYSRIDESIKQGTKLDSDYRIVFPDGEVRWIKALGSASYNEANQPMHITGICIDITERIKMEETLRHRTALLEAQMNSTIDGILVVDAQGKKIFQNQQTIELWKIPQHIADNNEDEVQVKHVMHMTKNPEKFVKKIAQLRRHPDKTSQDEVELTDGTVLDRYSSPIRGKDGQHFGRIWTFRNITQLKQAEKDKKKAYDELYREFNQRKILSGRLIDLIEKEHQNIAMDLHDNIGQILTSLKLNIEIIHEKWNPKDKELDAHLKAARETSSQAMSEIREISSRLRPAMIDSLGLESSMRTLLNGVRQSSDIKIIFFSRNVPKHFNPEKELALYRILQEAMNNIMKHAMAKSVFINLIKKGKKITMSIEDDGAGFDYEKAIKISKKKIPLGLLIMRERVTLLDGVFTIESHVGKGAHLSVEIPL